MTVPSTRILVTGATGCLGSHFCELALSRGAQVHGFARRDGFPAGAKGRRGDITNPCDIRDCLEECAPDWIFHFAGLVHGAGNHAPEEMMRVNAEGTRHLLEAAQAATPNARVFVAGSSGIYGTLADTGKLLTENAAIRPASPYAASKAAQDAVAERFFREHGLHVVRGRIFNQTGPREPGGLVCATLARQVAQIEAGLQEPVLNAVTLTPRRDFCDVRDVAAGCWAALEHGAAGGAYNICSGANRSIREVAAILIGHAQLRGVRIVETDPDASFIPGMAGDFSRLRDCSGWTPRIPLEQSLHDLLDEWREGTRSAA